MDCKAAYAMMQDFLDGVLSPEQERRFDAHVAHCPSCARALRAYRSLDRMLGGMEMENAPEGFADPIIRFLRATGRIREGAVAAGAGRRGWIGWLPSPLRIPLAAAVAMIIALAAISIMSGSFLGAIGKGTVAATSAYIDVQETVSSVPILDDVSRAFEKDVRTAGTIVNAFFLLLSAAGRAYLVPASLMMIALIIGAIWYVRTSQKRSTGHASFCF